MGKMKSILPRFSEMSETEKLQTVLCPKSTAAAKLVNKFIRLMCLARDNITEGLENENHPTMPAHIYPCSYNFDNESDCDEWEQSFAELNLSEYSND